MAHPQLPHQQWADQHLAYRRQTSVQRQLQTAGDHNPWAAEAALEAYLQHQHQPQVALVAVQDLERQRVWK